MPEPLSYRSPSPPGRSVLGRLIELLRPQWGKIALGVVLLLLSMPAELFPAFVWLYVADGLAMKDFSGRPVRIMHSLCSFGGRIEGWPKLLVSALGWLTVIYVVGETLQTLSGWIMQRVAQRFILGLRNTVYGKLQSQSLSYLQHQRTGDLMSRAMGDVDELQSFTVSSIDVIIGEGLMWFVTVVTVMLIDWRVASASLAPLVLVYVLLRVFNKRVAPIYKAAREKAGDVSTRLQENLSGVTVIKIFGREKQEAGRFRDSTEAYYGQQLRAINARSLYFPFTRAVGFLSNVNMIGLGGYLILTGQGFTVGKLVMFRSYWWRLFGPVQTLARVNDMVQRAMAAGRRVFEVLDAPEELPDSADARPVNSVKGDMALRGVTFSYSRSTGFQPVIGGVIPGINVVSRSIATGHGLEARATSVLHDISIDIPAGKTVALCGPSGSGKSTILNLLLRFYDPTAGEVTLDGVDLRRIERHSLRKHFALVQQESFLFNDSVLDNIRYGHGEATMEQVVAAAKAANAHGFISAMPDGYNTLVGERGVRLSGGQKQRLSIARAFLANPAILLLDEPTSSVEPDSEAAIIAALDRLMQGRTTVITSHRPSLIQQADIVYVIQDGKIVSSGSVDALIEQGGWFARFMRSEPDEVQA